MNTILNILLIEIIVCFVIDLSGFIQSLEVMLSKWLKIKAVIPKPFSCSLCSVWWINLIYLIVVNKFTLPYIATVALLSFFSKNISGLLLWIREMLIKIEDLLYRIIR